MYIGEFVMACERALGYEAETGAGLSARETAVLAEIDRLRASKKAKRVPAANEARLRDVTRDVAREMLDGEPAARVAKKYGISENQARRVAAQEMQAACRGALGRRAGQATLEVATLDWIVSTGRDAVLRRARSNIGLVNAALIERWNVQDAKAKGR